MMSIKVKLERMNNAVHFKASNENGICINIDGAEKYDRDDNTL